ncbi:hypothetical protein N0V83_002104 [Neocucurbitaria cava]|uniref:Uncharacterized protein n=1 Tax=Neocucurbitaria cava TaxID=798079 RepID=A0A9W8YDI3_9PLEO|nr:hypothetical protein N0V83_002104 [Neocucurbitaria cava]
MSKPPLPSPNSRRDATTANTSLSPTSPTASRPPLQRLAASDASYQAQTSLLGSRAPAGDRDDETTDTDMSEDEETPGQGGAAGMGREASKVAPPHGKASPDETEIERLRSLQLKLLQQQQQQQQRAHLRGTQSPGPPFTASSRRISPIKEESITLSTMSPTLEGAFDSPSPLPTGHTTSTESTESARTIRGSMPPTPAGHQALRTPSYPFPTVPNTPRWASAFHMPFTNLSPTVSAINAREYTVPKERVASETSTPAASTTPFAPGERIQHSTEAEDPRFPSPNLYDLVLRLGSDPGLAAWWTAVTSIMCEHYGVERATLAVPADASDIENVPWGQKTSFTATTDDGSPRMATYQDVKVPQSRKESTQQQQGLQHFEQEYTPHTALIPERRPKLFSHHSFAGHERQRQHQATDSPTPTMPLRPRGPLRAASHAPQVAMREHPLRQVSRASFDGTSNPFPSATPSAGPTFSDPEFSSVGEPSSPCAVFNVLRALDHEPDALIDNTGINRVLERGRLVTLTRDYSTSFSTSREDLADKDNAEQHKSSTTQATFEGHDTLKTTATRGRTALTTSDPRLQPRYEEYEQYPSSPWAQSPAPLARDTE